MIHDAYVRVSSPMAKTAAGFFHIMNSTDEDDRLIDVSSEVAAKVELHTHKEIGDGVMKMMHVPEGFVVPANGMHALARGGDHVMFMGLNGRLAHGDVVTVTLTFENAGEITLDIPVDLERKDDEVMDHSTMDHGSMDHSGEVSSD